MQPSVFFIVYFGFLAFSHLVLVVMVEQSGLLPSCFISGSCGLSLSHFLSKYRVYDDSQKSSEKTQVVKIKNYTSRKRTGLSFNILININFLLILRIKIRNCFDTSLSEYQYNSFMYLLHK